MIPLIWIRGIIAATVIAVILSLGYSAYSRIKHVGYLEAEAKYEQVLKEYRESVLVKLDTIESNSRNLAESQNTNAKNLAKNMSTITANLKGKTLTIIKNGECSPSKEFSDSFGTINRTVNESIRDK